MNVVARREGRGGWIRTHLCYVYVTMYVYCEHSLEREELVQQTHFLGYRALCRQ